MILMKWPAFTVLAVILLTGSSSARASQRPCTSAEAQRADLEADKLRTWDALYKSYKRYAHCDDGAIAEGYSESVARILVDHWKTLSELVSFSKNDAKFFHFVLRHLDATLNPTDVEKIKANATDQCPTSLQATCVDLRKKAESTLKEINSVD